MVATEIERGNTAVLVHGLPDVLQQECAELPERFAHPNRFFLGFAGDDLAGCVGVTMKNCDAEVSRLYVRESYRGGGIARQLMKGCGGLRPRARC